MGADYLTAGATFVVTLAALRLGHDLSDHWLQTDGQARNKATCRDACAAHVVVLTVTKMAIIAVTLAVLNLVDASHLGLTLAAVALDGMTHYWADRRWTLKTLASITGKGKFYDLAPPLGGAYLLDQSWHHACLYIAALIAASGSWILLGAAAAAFAAVAVVVQVAHGRSATSA